MKLPIFYLVIYAEILYVSTAADTFYDGEACLIQYLQKKGLLDKSFKSLQKPSPNCVLVMPLTKIVLRKTFTERIEKDLPDYADCLILNFDDQQTLDLVIKISVILETNAKTGLESTRQALRDDLKKIMAQCETNDERFISTFNDYLENKNVTLEEVQQVYCMSKYVADNKVLDLTNVELNPGQIETSNLDCNRMIERFRNESERELHDKILSMRQGQKILDCVMEAYKSGGIFDAGIALKVLYSLDVPKDVNDSERAKLTEKLSGFALTTYTCL